MNKIKILFLLLIFAVVIGVLSFGVTFAFFKSTATSTNNVFSAAQQFATPTPTPTSTPTPTPTPGVAQTLILNEMVYNTTCGNNDNAKAANYWIELYNGSNQIVDLKNWQFQDGNNNIIQISNKQFSVNPGQYVVITKDGSVFSGNSPCFVLQDSPLTANLGGNSDFLPATTGGVVKLEQPDPNNAGQFIVVDRVEYGPTRNGGVLNPPADQSIARNPNAFDSALGDTFHSSDFVVDSTPSPGVSN